MYTTVASLYPGNLTNKIFCAISPGVWIQQGGSSFSSKLKAKRKFLKVAKGTMHPVKVHQPICMNLQNLQSLMNSILIGKTPGIVIFMNGSAQKWFSGPNILNFENIFVQICSNLITGGFFPQGQPYFSIICLKNFWGAKIPKEKLFFFSHFSKI